MFEKQCVDVMMIVDITAFFTRMAYGDRQTYSSNR